MLSDIGLECFIRTNKQACQEYSIVPALGARPEPAKTADSILEAYIQLEAEREFEIAYMVKDNFSFGAGNALQLHVIIDGHRITNVVVQKEEPRNVLDKISKAEYCRNRRWWS